MLAPRSKSATVFLLFAAICFGGCGRAPTPQAAKESAVAKLERAHGRLVQTVAGGNLPTDIGRMGREAGVLAASAKGTPTEEIANKLDKQIADFEELIGGAKKPTVEAAKKALDEIGASIAQLKSKLG
jgi:cytochrome c556